MKKIVALLVLAAVIGGYINHQVSAAPVNACVDAHTSAQSDDASIRQAVAECQQ